PLLDRAGARRVVSAGAAAGRALAALYAATHTSSLLLFPAVFLVLVLSKVHSVTKNGLVAAYADRSETLIAANAQLGRVAAVAVALVAGPAVLALKLGGAPLVLYLSAATYAMSALLNLRLPRPRRLGGDAVPSSSVLAGAAAVFPSSTYGLPSLALFALLAGGATEIGRLAFQSLMQREAPGGVWGRVFVRYEVAFQLAWVAGALVPAMISIPFR